MFNRKFSTSLLLLAALTSGAASAHPRWLLPSEFSISSQEGDWITTDATASHGTFVFDKPLSVDSGYVLTPLASASVLPLAPNLSANPALIFSLAKPVHTS
nr:DUF4198 domain-containing protein [Vibrio navarrensis]